MRRISAVIGFLLAVAMAAGHSQGVRGADDPLRPAERSSLEYAFQLDRKVPLHASSPAVVWRGINFRLLEFGSVLFHQEGPHLTATLLGGRTTFDNVTYDVYAAVFDDKGKLLGTGSIPVQVRREWLGKVLNEHVEAKLDFGSNEDFSQARTFSVAVSRRKVLTPDQWQK